MLVCGVFAVSSGIYIDERRSRWWTRDLNIGEGSAASLEWCLCLLSKCLQLGTMPTDFVKLGVASDVHGVRDSACRAAQVLLPSPGDLGTFGALILEDGWNGLWDDPRSLRIGLALGEF